MHLYKDTCLLLRKGIDVTDNKSNNIIAFLAKLYVFHI